MASTYTNRGYYLLLANGDVRGFGDARDYGDAVGRTGAQFTGITIEKATGRYLVVANDASVFAFGPTSVQRAAAADQNTGSIHSASVVAIIVVCSVVGALLLIAVVVFVAVRARSRPPSVISESLLPKQ